MQWRNTQHSYGVLAISLHWFLAVALFGTFLLGNWMVDLTYYDDWYHRAPELHKALGVLILGLMLLRLIWRWGNPKPLPLGKIAWQNRIAESVHHLFYWLVLGIGFSGYLISTAEGQGIDVFGLFTVPALDWHFELQADRAGLIHQILAWSFITLALLHLSAALKHHFIHRDRTLTRILKP
ncbi:cytochrome b [Thiosulfatimonas sediminis]|uniref:Cytochrome b n=1 Tax=Thiosulfatimonas sediminis TaxID=2675054 RepID=A0A6F8PRH3_9GAMM|nr:cytochrome b [Thiosulfatimonas sediminis]BBP44715.1 cytochrome b [Thiosulfatimonas sediminis]